MQIGSTFGDCLFKIKVNYFRLNEGFTVFVERKILGRLYGKVARDFDCITGWEDDLYNVIAREFSPVHEFTKLIPSLPGIDPDEGNFLIQILINFTVIAFCSIPYEKVNNF